MANKNLYLIGTVPFDLKGPQRLEGLLKHLSPDIVALEFHKDRKSLIEERKSASPEVEEKKIDDALREVGLSLTPKQRKTMLEGGREITSVIGYEFTVCRNYTHANPKSKLKCIGISISENEVNKFEKGYISFIKWRLETIAQEPKLRKLFLKTLSRGKKAFLQQLNESVDVTYKNAEMMGELVEFLRDPETFEIIKKRLPANAVQSLKQIYNPRRDEVMADNIKQLYGRGYNKLVAVVGLLQVPGIKSRMSELEPTLMTLADYDKY